MNFFYKNKINRKKITIRKGIRQECTILPIIFNTYIQQAIDIQKKKTYLEMDKKYRYVARFDDDIAILSEKKEF